MTALFCCGRRPQYLGESSDNDSPTTKKAKNRSEDAPLVPCLFTNDSLSVPVEQAAGNNEEIVDELCPQVNSDAESSDTVMQQSPFRRLSTSSIEDASDQSCQEPTSSRTSVPPTRFNRNGTSANDNINRSSPGQQSISGRSGQQPSSGRNGAPPGQLHGKCGLNLITTPNNWYLVCI